MQAANWELAGGNTSLVTVTNEDGTTTKIEKSENEVPIYWKYLPSAINAILIVAFGLLYRWLSKKLVANENHRFYSGIENSLINKTYLFEFVNTYISNFVAIFYNQSFPTLAINLVIVMIFKQVFMNVWEYFSERYFIGKKLTEVEELF